MTEEEVETYRSWLTKHHHQLEQLTPAENEKYHHDNDRVSEQTFPDYLDCLNEWIWCDKIKERELLESVIHFFSRNHVRIQCTCGEDHVFTTEQQKDKGDVITDSATEPINMECWFLTLQTRVRYTLENIEKEQYHLSDPLEALLPVIASWRHVIPDVQQFLPLEKFYKIWTSMTRDTRRSKILKRSIGSTDMATLAAVYARSVPKVSEQGKRVLLHFPHAHHGLHALKRVLNENEFLDVFHGMMRLRRSIDPNTDKIRITDVEDRMTTCVQCQAGRKGGIPPQAIYYAPPGSGKTTATERECIIAFDTDWVGVGPTWPDYHFILDKGLSIITNQAEAFIGSGIKIVGVVRKTIRTDDQGKPLAYRDQIMNWAKTQKRNVIFWKTPDHKYVTDYAIELMIIALIQRKIANYSINMLPCYQNETSEEWMKAFPKMMKRQYHQEN